MSNVSKSLMQGAFEALEYSKGQKKQSKTHKVEIPDQIDVQAIRENCHMTREEFSNQFGFSIRTLEKWERGERVPEGPTRAYLSVIAKSPETIAKLLEQKVGLKKEVKKSDLSKSKGKILNKKLGTVSVKKQKNSKVQNVA